MKKSLTSGFFLSPLIFLLVVNLLGGMVSADDGDYLSAENILIVVNSNSPDSIEVGNYYQTRRGVPLENLFQITTSTSSTVNADTYRNEIATPIFDYINDVCPNNILCILLAYGVPYKISGTGGEMGTRASVDSELAAQHTSAMAGCSSNPYYNSGVRFNREDFVEGHGHSNMYLVCRLDGPTKELAKGLVDKAISAEFGAGGKGYFDKDPDMTRPGDPPENQRIQNAYDLVTAEGFETVLDEEGALYSGDGSNALWYWGWYEGAYGTYANIDVYDWRIGAMAVHTCSVGAVDLRNINHWAGGVINDGITATAGNVYEPYVGWTVLADKFFDYYISKGYTFAESAYACYPKESWMSVMVGDPLLKYYEFVDVDSDGLPDSWEQEYFGNLDQGPDDDPDNDGLTNVQEYERGTDPTNPDTDSDGMPDGWEVDNNLNPSFNDANENPDGDDYTNIQEYQQGTDPHAYTEFLPYETGFEPGEGFSLGNLHNQKGWQVTGGTAIVETNTVHSGAQAVTSPGRIHKSFTGTNDNIQWMDLYLQPVAAEKPQEIPSTLQSSIIYVDLNSEIICLNGNGDGTGQWLSTGVSVTSNTWHRITIRQDYNTHTWRIYVNGGLTPKLSNLGFKDNISSLNAFSIKDACLDTLYFGKDGDLDSDGLPDDWEQEYFGNLDQGPDDDPDNDGLTNVGEHQHNTNPVNPDTDSDNMPDGWEVDKGLNPLVNDANLDPDSDGQSNYNEYVANTDPLSATSLFKMTEAKQNAGNANYLDISWTFVEGKEYTIYYSNDPYSGTMTWDEVTGPTIITNDTTLTWTDDGTLTGGVPPGEAEHRYYKVKVE